MKFRVQPKEQIQWSGGISSEWLIFPKEARYQDRNFLVRISTATVQQSPISFTALPNFNRYILLDQGECTLRVNKKEIPLSKTELFYFSGKDEVNSSGIYTDFNCIVSSDLTIHIKLLHLSQMATIDISSSAAFLFCLEGAFHSQEETYHAPCCMDMTDETDQFSILAKGRIIYGEFL